MYSGKNKGQIRKGRNPESNVDWEHTLFISLSLSMKWWYLTAWHQGNTQLVDIGRYGNSNAEKVSKREKKTWSTCTALFFRLKTLYSLDSKEWELENLYLILKEGHAKALHI